MIAVRVVDFAIERRLGGVQPSPLLLGPALLQVVLQALGHEGSGLYEELLLRLSWVLHPCAIDVVTRLPTGRWKESTATTPTSYMRRGLGWGGGSTATGIRQRRADRML